MQPDTNLNVAREEMLVERSRHIPQLAALRQDLPTCAEAADSTQLAQQNPKQPKRRSHGLLAREEVLELAKKAREAIFPTHDSEVGLARTQAHVVHGVVSASALAGLEKQHTRRQSPRSSRAASKAPAKTAASSPRTKHTSSPGLAVAIGGHARSGSGQGEGLVAEKSGAMCARGVGGEAAVPVTPVTPTGALAAVMNRALRLKGGPNTPINKAASRKTVATAATVTTPRAMAGGGEGKRQGNEEAGAGAFSVYRYLGDDGAGGSHEVGAGEGGGPGADRFLQEIYGLDGGFHAGKACATSHAYFSFNVFKRTCFICPLIGSDTVG